MKSFILSLIAVVCFIPSFSQSTKKNLSSQPLEESNVIKEYDENGNLTRYDSTYTYSWSNADTLFQANFEEITKQMDQMMKQFHQNMNLSSFTDSLFLNFSNIDLNQIQQSFESSFSTFGGKDSVIFTYPLDSTMMIPIDDIFSSEFLHQMMQNMPSIDEFISREQFQELINSRINNSKESTQEESSKK
ncbi:MAG: hypothetical protein ACK5IJ_04060 [Mangrovibacterium sp.]